MGGDTAQRARCLVYKHEGLTYLNTVQPDASSDASYLYLLVIISIEFALRVCEICVDSLVGDFNMSWFCASRQLI